MAKGRKPAKGGPRGTREADSDDSASEEDTKRPTERPTVGKQRSNVGMMPPSDSESGSESGSDEEDAPRRAAPPAKSAGGGQPATAGMLPPSDSDEDDDEDESDDEEEAAAAPRGKRVVAPVEKSPAEIAAELEKLELVRKRRAEQAAQRIAAEGYDRFAPK